MMCPKCMHPIGPDDKVCPECHSILVVERKPTRPDEEKGWTLRHLAAIMGQAGCALMIAQNAVVLIASGALAGRALDFLAHPDTVPDIGAVATLGIVANIADLIGLALIAVSLVALGAGAMLLRRKDPFTEEEVALPTRAAVFPVAAGLLVFVWVLLTAVWRVAYPAARGTTAAQLLAEFGATGPASMPAEMGLMMALWIVGAIVLFVAALLLGQFGRHMPARVHAPRSLKTTAWTDYTVFNLIVVLGIAVFPLGWAGFPALQIVYLTFLATKLTVLAVFGLLTYWTLLGRFETFGKLSLMVPVMKAIPGEVSTAQPVVQAEVAKTAPPEPTVFLPAPTEDDMKGIEHVK